MKQWKGEYQSVCLRFSCLYSLLLAAEADVAAGVWGRRGWEASTAGSVIKKKRQKLHLKMILRAYKWFKIGMWEESSSLSRNSPFLPVRSKSSLPSVTRWWGFSPVLSGTLESLPLLCCCERVRGSVILRPTHTHSNFTKVTSNSKSVLCPENEADCSLKANIHLFLFVVFYYKCDIFKCLIIKTVFSLFLRSHIFYLFCLFF